MVRILYGLVLVFLTTFAFARDGDRLIIGATDTLTSTSAASAAAAGGGATISSGSSIAAVFPSAGVANSSGSAGCNNHGTLNWGILWNLFYIGVPKHGFDEDCAFNETIAVLGAKCQFWTVKTMMDDRLKRKFNIDPAATAASGPEAYKADIATRYRDYTFEECASFRGAPVQNTKIVAEGATDTKQIYLDSAVLFQTASAVFSPNGKSRLTAAMQVYDPQRDTVSLIEGHTDDVGSDDYNQSLSDMRALAVAKHLRGLGFTVTDVIGYGKTRPLFEGKDAASRAGNRRVAIYVKQVIIEKK